MAFRSLFQLKQLYDYDFPADSMNICLLVCSPRIQPFSEVQWEPKAEEVTDTIKLTQFNDSLNHS